ncbi:CoA transferase [Streptomonospora litoralis]|uniref:E-cinnamoyl-CoA:R-phenyllactate CoA transferase n=1 Tax=Streptomonospora litoralis TaxID=2498135 RepID=A0A4P6Q8S0_9ACTN|nr:CoA transferase [Streptomonospora litoralis]QBI55524.1 E-cinnamoyl-CoA:R-phenyllactate CoA transferase [Streptomonospora litoralis]
MTVSSDRSPVTDAGAPLDGFAVEGSEGSAAADIAIRQLRMLGAASPGPDVAVRGAGRARARAEAGSAGSLVLAADHARVACALDWAGPLALPLEDEPGVQAACGLMHVHGRSSGGPRPLAIDYASAVGGVLSAQGLLAALIGRLRGGAAELVRTSVAQAALISVGQYLAAATASGDERDAPAAPGGPPFTSADGVPFEIETFEAERWERFWSLLGADRAALARGWQPFQHRYAAAVCPLPPELHATAAARVFREAAGAAQAAGISIVRVHGAAGERRRSDAAEPPPWRLTGGSSDTPGPPPAPCRPGAGLPLDGLVVVESTRRVQGPLAGHLLRLLGAEVLRIEPPGGDPLRWVPPTVGTCSARFLALNRGKHVVEADLKTPEGRRQVRELTAGADVFLHNWAPGKAAVFGLDSADLFAVRPGLVYAHASGWGDARQAGAAMGGAEPLGTDFLVQAHSGLGGLVRPRGEEPAPSLMTLTDVLGGLLSAQGVLAGLLARCRGAGGIRVDSALYDGAALLTAAAPSGGARRPRWGPLHPPLRTGDGYLALGPHARSSPDRVARALGADRPAADAAAAVARLCRGDRAADVAERLRGAGLSATPVCTDLADLAADPRIAGALDTGGAAFVRSPWEFTS